jgi:hypothetical protein
VDCLSYRIFTNSSSGSPKLKKRGTMMKGRHITIDRVAGIQAPQSLHRCTRRPSPHHCQGNQPVWYFTRCGGLRKRLCPFRPAPHRILHSPSFPKTRAGTRAGRLIRRKSAGHWHRRRVRPGSGKSGFAQPRLTINILPVTDTHHSNDLRTGINL